MLPDAAGGTLLFAGAAALAFVHLRHLGLVGIVVLAPVPGLAAVATVAEAFGAGAQEALPLAWTYGLAAALLLADEMTLRIVAGTPAWQAVRAALAARGAALLWASATLAVSLGALGVASASLWHGAAVAGLALGAVASAAASLLLAGSLPYGEDFAARSNRMRERWNGLFDLLIAVARPRWGFAVAGMTLVFCVLGVFGAQALTLAGALRASPVVVVVPGVAAVAATILAIRDWRVIASTLMALSVAVLIGLWGFAKLGQPFDGTLFVLFCLSLGAGGIGLMASSIEAGRYAQAGDDATIATARVLSRAGPGVFFAATAIASALALWAVSAGPVGVVLAVVAVFAGAGTLLFQPAFAIVLETWFPRPATVAARYRLH